MRWEKALAPIDGKGLPGKNLYEYRAWPGMFQLIITRDYDDVLDRVYCKYEEFTEEAIKAALAEIRLLPWLVQITMRSPCEEIPDFEAYEDPWTIFAKSLDEAKTIAIEECRMLIQDANAALEGD